MIKEGPMDGDREIGKDEVLTALRGMKAAGMHAYETADPRAIPVQALLDAWWAQIQAKAKQESTPAAAIRASVARNLILVEAGYDDREMIDSVCDWLEHDQDDAERIKDAGLVAEIGVKIDELKARLRS